MRYTGKWTIAGMMMLTFAASAFAEGDPPAEADASTGHEDATLFPIEDYTGDLWSRSRLTGDWGGSRTDLAAQGIQFELNITQVLQGNLSGGTDNNNGLRYGGSLDYVIKLDFQKMGLWPGAFLKIRGETQFGQSNVLNTGAISPVNTDALFPVLDDHETALSDFTFVQFLSEWFAVMLGKIDTLDGDANEFAHGRGLTQFMNTSMVMNPIAARTIPVSALGVGFLLVPSDSVVFSFMALDPEGSPTTSGFDTAFEDATALAAELRVTTNFFGMTGHQLFGVTWSDKQFVSLDQDPRTILVRILLPGLGLPLKKEEESWSFYYNFDQYLFVEEGDPSQGFGIFARFGVSDGEANPIEEVYSIGIGGRGIIPGRDDDTFGLGYYYIDFSDDLPGVLRIGQEHGVELFYNIAVTPWLHITPDLQVIDPGRKANDTVVVAGLRAQMKF